MATNHSVGRRDWYRVPGVDRQAGGDTIRVAYRELAWRLHPDRQQSPAAAEACPTPNNGWPSGGCVRSTRPSGCWVSPLVGEPTTMVASWLRRRSDQADRPPVVPNVRAARWSRCRTITATTWWTWPATACTDCCSRAWFRRWWRCFSWGSSCSVRLPAVASRTRRRPPPAACWGTRWSIAPSPTKGASSASPTVPIGAPTGRGWSGWLSSTASSRNRPVATVVPTLAW
ncbi:MAG: J domain-containing protein [Candidatus Microthrix sp.]|nr:J domain-containing protein [Candidatus Microthrix sp.]